MNDNNVPRWFAHQFSNWTIAGNIIGKSETDTTKSANNKLNMRYKKNYRQVSASHQTKNHNALWPGRKKAHIFLFDEYKLVYAHNNRLWNCFEYVVRNSGDIDEEWKRMRGAILLSFQTRQKKIPREILISTIYH